ncbi:MAG: hypothetical protein IKY58_01295 [Paludibacteraceae bacterium]|nr:hypothetical protein [Paludibacteraceae bacterium]
MKILAQYFSFIALTLFLCSIEIYGDTRETKASNESKNLLEKGYRGMVDFGGTIGHETNGITLSTTHGLQVIPSYLFIGVGIGADGLGNFSSNSKKTLYNFICLRSDFMKKRLTPYLDFRVGAEYLEYQCCYLSQSFGINIPAKSIKNAIGIDFSVGLNTNLNHKVNHYFWNKQTYSESYFIMELPNIYLKMGVEW